MARLLDGPPRRQELDLLRGNSFLCRLFLYCDIFLYYCDLDPRLPAAAAALPAPPELLNLRGAECAPQEARAESAVRRAQARRSDDVDADAEDARFHFE